MLLIACEWTIWIFLYLVTRNGLIIIVRALRTTAITLVRRVIDVVPTYVNVVIVVVVVVVADVVVDNYDGGGGGDGGADAILNVHHLYMPLKPLLGWLVRVEYIPSAVYISVLDQLS